MKSFLSPTPARRTVFFTSSDAIITLFSLYAAFLLRFDFAVPERFLIMFFSAAPLFVVIKLLFLGVFGLYRMTWRYAGLHDLVNVARACFLAQIALYVIIHSIGIFMDHQSPYTGFPRSVYIIDGAISFLLISALRGARRAVLEVFWKKTRSEGAPAVIVGAGNVGETVLRDIRRQAVHEYRPVCFLDDDDKKAGQEIHGVRVEGKLGDLSGAIKRHKAGAVIIAIPSLGYKDLREIYAVTRKAGVKNVKIVPGIYSDKAPGINIKKLEDIKIEDILGRKNISIDFEEIEGFLRGKSVLVTGAGGSIGSEIVMQAAVFKPSRLVLLDVDETELHEMLLRLQKRFESEFSFTGEEEDGIPRAYFVVADVSDPDRVRAVLERFKPDVVFHAAAYKHVPMMEDNPEEAVRVNVLGTYTLSKAACAACVERFVMISTDKAVKPESVMGLTKRMAEYICKSFSGPGDDCPSTKFISVRFGNVLGSRGSILPIFLRQLSEGGPLTVTHREMKRYFMTIPEAVSLVLQASVIGSGGDIMVLDMGEPVSIVSLAEDVIKIHGLKPYRDIDIVFSGIRPGEKLFEEILTAEEVSTRHEKIFVVGNSGNYSLQEIEEVLDDFRQALSSNEIGNGIIKNILLKYAYSSCGSRDAP